MSLVGKRLTVLVPPCAFRAHRNSLVSLNCRRFLAIELGPDMVGVLLHYSPRIGVRFLVQLNVHRQPLCGGGFDSEY